jgi:hypothetical protein
MGALPRPGVGLKGRCHGNVVDETNVVVETNGQEVPPGEKPPALSLSADG